jgi:prepilin peptidase CpaA
MTTAPVLANASLIALLTTAAVCDVRTRRIPNWLVASGLIVALVAQWAAQGAAAGTWAWFSGAAMGLMLFAGLYLMRTVGAGDVKLMGTVGAFTGPIGAAHVALVSCLAGGLLALGMILFDRESRKSLADFSALLLSLPVGDRAVASEDDEQGTCSNLKVPYAVAIAAGTLLVNWRML